MAARSTLAYVKGLALKARVWINRNQVMSDNRENILVDGKSIQIIFTNKAKDELDKRRLPLYITMELLFSCLIRKRVYFSDEPTGFEGIELGTFSGMSLRFTPVMTKACHIDELQGSPDAVPFPLAEKVKFIPRWLAIDFQASKGWTGDFGYSDQLQVTAAT